MTVNSFVTADARNLRGSPAELVCTVFTYGFVFIVYKVQHIHALRHVGLFSMCIAMSCPLVQQNGRSKCLMYILLQSHYAKTRPAQNKRSLHTSMLIGTLLAGSFPAFWDLPRGHTGAHYMDPAGHSHPHILTLPLY